MENITLRVVRKLLYYAYNCPKCKKQLIYPEQDLPERGEIVKCIVCGKRVRVEDYAGTWD